MAKKYWVSLPLITAADVKDEAVVSFLKGGAKKELEVETAAFILKWLMDKNVPFGIDFESCTVDRAVVLDALPRRLQKALGHKVSATGQPGGDELAVEAAADLTVTAATGTSPASVTPGVPDSVDSETAVESGTPQE